MIEMEKSEKYFLTQKKLNFMIINESCQELKTITEDKEYEISIVNKNIKQITNIADNIFKIPNLKNMK